MLQPYLDRELTEAERKEAEVHLDGCTYCSKRYRFEEKLRRFVRQAVDRADGAALLKAPPGEAALALDRSGPGGSPPPAGHRHSPRLLEGRGRRTGRGAAGARARPRRGSRSQTDPREQDRVAAVAVVGGGHDLGSALAPGVEHAVDRGRREVGPVCRARRRRGFVSGASAARPQRSDAPRPRSQSGQWTVGAEDGTSCAPSTTSTSGTELWRTRSRTGSSRTSCLGLPKRVDAPAARTTVVSSAATRRLSPSQVPSS